MEFKIEKQDNHTLIQVLEEKLDTHIAPTLKSELVLVSGNGEKNIILDLSKCRYCDSSGLITISQLDTVLNITSTIDDGVGLIAETSK
jgi:anti-sigma B factor antagonist